MITFYQYLDSSIGKKTVMAATGLFLCLFLLEHLYGNILLYDNDAGAAFIEYSHTMAHNILIRIIEVVLFAAIVLHVIQALVLTSRNSQARPIGYEVKSSSAGASWFSKNMGITGSVVLFFIIIHLYNFFLPYRITSMPGGINLAQSVKAAFQNPFYAGLYFVGVTFLFFHLNHGFRSAFHTLGLNNKKYMPILKNSGTAFALLMWVGFASFPVLFYFNMVGHSIIIP